MSEQYSTPEQALIERLRRAPQPELSSEARAMIRARILDALDHPPMPAPRRALPRPMMAVAVTVVAVTLIAGAALFALSQRNQTVVTPTTPATFTLVPPTETSTPTATTSVTATLTPTATDSPTLSITPTIVPTSSVGVITIIEGPVDHVDGNVITIYNVPVEVDPNDPVLGDIDEGDVVRVEGDTEPGTVVVVATTVIVVNVTPVGTVNPSNPTNPPTGEVWHDDGTCAHPPPDWAPANGWRRRCQGQEKQNNGNNKNNGNNGNNGNQGNGNGKHDG